jgi:hypothetical protein
VFDREARLMDEKLKALIKELSPIADDAQAVVVAQSRLEHFVDDLFKEIDVAISAERDKRVAGSQFWTTIRAAFDQIRRKALEN